MDFFNFFDFWGLANILICFAKTGTGGTGTGGRRNRTEPNRGFPATLGKSERICHIIRPSDRRLDDRPLRASLLFPSGISQGCSSTGPDRKNRNFEDRRVENRKRHGRRVQMEETAAARGLDSTVNFWTVACAYHVMSWSA